jgi:hypothetical protein
MTDQLLSAIPKTEKLPISNAIENELRKKCSEKDIENLFSPKDKNGWRYTSHPPV